MANTSIKAAFERMWQHVIAKLGDKANIDHNHNEMYYTETEIDTKLSAVNTNITNITSGSTPVKEAEHATSADSADEATHATSADSATTATSATKATQDGNGKIIADTYETKTDAQTKLDEAKAYADSVSSSAATTVKNDLLNGAGGAYDTLKELGDLIDTNVDAIEALETVASGKADKVHKHDDMYYTEVEIDEFLVSKQDKNFVITLSGNDTDGYIADKTYAEVAQAYNDGRNCILIDTDNSILTLTGITSLYVVFVIPLLSSARQVMITSANKVIYKRSELLKDATVYSNLTTTDKKIVGAINEVHDELDSHNHDDVYYTQTQVDTKLSGKANSSHKHAISDVTNLQSALDGKADASHGTHVTFDSTNKPKMDGTAAFGTSSKVARADHVHPTDTSRASQADLDALESVVAGKADSGHSHSVATTSANGFMSTDMVTKLNGIASGANKTTVDSSLSSSSTNPVRNSVVTTAINSATSAISANTSSINEHTTAISNLQTAVSEIQEITSAEIQALFA